MGYYCVYTDNILIAMSSGEDAATAATGHKASLKQVRSQGTSTRHQWSTLTLVSFLTKCLCGYERLMQRASTLHQQHLDRLDAHGSAMEEVQGGLHTLQWRVRDETNRQTSSSRRLCRRFKDIYLIPEYVYL